VKTELGQGQLSTSLYKSPAPARAPGEAHDPREPGKATPLAKGARDADYQVKLSSAAKDAALKPATLSESAPAASAVELPAPPSAPAPEISLPDVELPELAKSAARDEAIDKAQKAAKAEEKVRPGSQKRPAVVFVSSWQWMFSPSKSEGSYAGVERMAEAVPGARLYGWNQHDDIVEHIKRTHPDYPVVLVGHSLGGDTVKEVADTLDSLEHGFRKVDLLVTLDAVGFNHDIIPQNVREHLNVFGEGNPLLNDGPHVARRHELTNVKNILSHHPHTELDAAKDIQFEIMQAVDRALARGPR